MQEIIFNPRFLEHKKPFGAVPAKKEVSFSVKLSQNIECDELYFIYRKDNESTSDYIYMDKNESYDGYTSYSCKISFSEPDLYFYRFELKQGENVKYIGSDNGYAKIEEWLPEWQLTVYSDIFKTPDWAKGKVMYQIFPDRFNKSDNYRIKEAKNERKIHKNWYELPEFIYDTPDYKANDYFCGNIQGIIEKLGYLKTLGVDIIYLNPIFESPEYHRYSTGDYFSVDPYLGTNDDFKNLCEKANECGIRIILDGVFSHTGADSVYFNKFNHYNSNGAANSTTSPFYNWYNFIEYPHKYECWWGFDNLPNVNENNPEYTEYITGDNGVIPYWQNLGCSGWRLDVADELPDEFIDALYTSSKKHNANSFIIGEVWEDATNKFAYGKRRRYLLGNQMDSVMNYPWRTAILDFIKHKDENLFNERIYSILENYPSEVVFCLMNSISTHDTFRAINYLGVEADVKKEDYAKYCLSDEEYARGKEMLMQATFLQFTLPGIPCIYYGDEIGLDGFSDPYCRKTYPYGKEDCEILSFIRNISHIRKKYHNEFLSQFSLYKKYEGFYSFKIGNLLCAICLNENGFLLTTQKNEIVFSKGNITKEDTGYKLSYGSYLIIK